MKRVIVRLYAHCADRLGPETSIEVADDATATTIAEELSLRDSRLGEIVASCRVAINQEFAQWTDALADNDEVAIIPPVSGG